MTSLLFREYVPYYRQTPVPWRSIPPILSYCKNGKSGKDASKWHRKPTKNFSLVQKTLKRNYIRAVDHRTSWLKGCFPRCAESILHRFLAIVKKSSSQSKLHTFGLSKVLSSLGFLTRFIKLTYANNLIHEKFSYERHSASPRLASLPRSMVA